MAKILNANHYQHLRGNTPMTQLNARSTPSHRQKKPTYIAIEGCIGVGKTTLSDQLAKRLQGKQVLETVEENPFLSDFYKDISANAFRTQIFFLLSRYKQQQSIGQRDLFEQSIVSDYFIVKDRIFAELTLSGSELALYEQVYQTLCHQIHAPDLIIYLRAPLDIVLGRIQRRGRPFEKDIDPNYLTNLTKAYDLFFKDFNLCPVLTIETEDLNFLEREEDLSCIVDAISETINQKKSKHLVTTGKSNQPNLFG